MIRPNEAGLGVAAYNELVETVGAEAAALMVADFTIRKAPATKPVR